MIEKKPITDYIDRKYSGKQDKETIKRLFVLGYDIGQIHLITGGVKIKEIMNTISYEDIIKRAEKSNLNVDFLYKITGLEFSN